MRDLFATALSLPNGVLGVHELLLSTFPADYLPDGSAVLHRSSTSGCLLVHALLGAIRVQVWNEAMGTYKRRPTWIEPAFANDIATKDASALEPARALVMVITNNTPLAISMDSES